MPCHAALAGRVWHLRTFGSSRLPHEASQRAIPPARGEVIATGSRHCWETRIQEDSMAFDTFMVYVGVYPDVDSSEADYDLVKACTPKRV